MPAIVKSVAKDIGLSEAQVKIDLKAASPSVAPILTELCNSREFTNLIKQNVGAIEASKEMIERTGQIDSLKKKTDREQNDIDDTRKIYDDPIGRTGAKQWFNNGLSAPDKLAIPSAVNDYANMMQELNDASLGRFQRSTINRGEIPGYLASLNRELAGLFNGVAGVTIATLSAPGGIVYAAERKITPNMDHGVDKNEDRRQQLITKADKFFASIQAAQGIEDIYARRVAAGGSLDTELGKYKLYSEADEKLRGLKGREDTLDADKASLKTLQTLQAKDVSKIAGKIENVMERSFKEYYNKVQLKRGQELAEFDAQQKTELKQKEADLKVKREEIAQVLLDKYLRMTYLKYQGGNTPTGYDDKGLKKLVKEDLFNHSPADMARELLKRVYDARGDFPDTYRKEMDVLIKEMGVGAGPPRVTFNDVLKKMDTAKLTEFAATEMPKAFGFAKARGYYFDRLRLKRHQVEFITSTDYGEGFFEKMLDAAKTYASQMDNEKLRSEVFRSIDVAMRQLRDKTLGKDYQEGIKNALKVATIAGAATAGTYFIGGPYALGRIAATVGNVGVAAGAAATTAVSRATNFVDTAAVDAITGMGLHYTGPKIPINPTSAFGQGFNSVPATP
ncbi:MAG: hypothetical protein UR63_C0036G0003 [Candidatus Roizmanbacteria bacterium GW2011_GWC2_35_12]|uniref:Uncharacterized protein n=1 Tax=Candidatus Roizmanbacteria bacterium GW2011_GWC2_35_12 TaxID=1618485 RepID=A0A0G0B9X8_9BACT|nr:MAG: hypothetical protein UR63_C0036G0003 [Candidatus Roizmanbacteria bacterium GW2011_GWC2_35_12]